MLATLGDTKKPCYHTRTNKDDNLDFAKPKGDFSFRKNDPSHQPLWHTRLPDLHRHLDGQPNITGHPWIGPPNGGNMNHEDNVSLPESPKDYLAKLTSSDPEPEPALDVRDKLARPITAARFVINTVDLRIDKALAFRKARLKSAKYICTIPFPASTMIVQQPEPGHGIKRPEKRHLGSHLSNTLFATWAAAPIKLPEVRLEALTGGDLPLHNNIYYCYHAGGRILIPCELLGESDKGELA